MISFVVTLAPIAVDTEVPLTKWPEMIDTSMPANVKVSFNHLAIVQEATGLWALLIATNSFLVSLGLRGAVDFLILLQGFHWTQKLPLPLAYSDTCPAGGKPNQQNGMVLVGISLDKLPSEV